MVMTMKQRSHGKKRDKKFSGPKHGNVHQRTSIPRVQKDYRHQGR